MCGIAGVKGVNKNGIANRVAQMIDAFPYRGPDGDGIYTDSSQTLGLGHKRLSILDISSAGAQPMESHDKQSVIVHNGEIYNYIEIREELEKNRGFKFRTGTDTEVVLAAFEAWGPECVNRFNGMWAFAIFDHHKDRLFLCRDRLGIKPLYYYQDPQGNFYFASEIKALLEGLETSPELAAGQIDAFMSFGYVPGSQTMFKGIKRLMPGHWMIIDGNNNIQTDKYWDLTFQDQGPDKGFAHYLEKGQSLLEDAISLRLRSDVPLGIFLSGGLDSSSVVGLLASRVSQPLKTFSVAYKLGKQFNETPWARQVADTFHTDHHEFFVTQEQFKDFIPDYVRYMDEPVTEAAAISLYFISKMAKDHVTVVLSGEGSDEIFGGYDLYRYMAYLDQWHSLLGPKVSRKISKIASRILPNGHKLSKYLNLGSLPLETRYKGISTYDSQLKQTLYRPEFLDYVQKGTEDECTRFIEDLFEQTKANNALNRMLYFDTKTWLVDDLLIKADRMSMAASLELRVPFLDYRMVEFAASLPTHYKIRNGQGKYLLKKMMKPILPDNIIHRKKMGFPTPLKIMFETGLSSYASDLLCSSDTRLNSYFDTKAVQTLVTDHIRGKRDHHKVIWQLIVFETWMRTWIKK